MKLIAYCRVSTAEQAKTGYSLDAQEHMIRDYAQRSGHTIVRVFKEQVSGAASVRPILEEAVNALDEADGLIVIRLDRFVRSVLQFCLWVEKLEAIGKTLVSVGDGLDMSSPAGRMMAHVLAAVGQYERDMISHRTREGLAERKRGGQPLGRPPRNIEPAIAESIQRQHAFGSSLRDNANIHNVTVHTVRRIVC